MGLHYQRKHPQLHHRSPINNIGYLVYLPWNYSPPPKSASFKETDRLKLSSIRRAANRFEF